MNHEATKATQLCALASLSPTMLVDRVSSDMLSLRYLSFAHLVGHTHPLKVIGWGKLSDDTSLTPFQAAVL